MEGQEIRRENGGSPVRGELERRGLLWGGGDLYFLEPQLLHLLREHKPSLYFQLSTAIPWGRLGGDTHSATLFRAKENLQRD